jgi:hypothetical protein
MHGRERSAWAGAAVVFASLMFLSGFALGFGTSDHVPTSSSSPVLPSAGHAFAPPPPVRKVVSQQFTGTEEVYDVASIGREVLSAVELKNGSYGLYLSNMRTNTSKFLGVTPGGSSDGPGGMVAAGGEFFVSFVNFTTLVTTVEEVSTTGAVSVPPLTFPTPVPPGWEFVYGNSTSLYASASGSLVEFNPTTYAVVNKFSTYWGVLDAFAILPVGDLLYLAGTYYDASYSGSQFFGFYNTSSNVSKMIAPLQSYPTDIYGDFTTLGMRGGDIFVGGGTFIYRASPFNNSNLEGLFFRYSPATGTLTNLSSHLPAYNAWVWALEPFKTGLFLYTGNFALTATSAIYTAGIYVLYSGTKLTNLTSALPRNFLGDFSEITSESAGFVYLGGDNSASDLAEIAAVQT